jgi:hypothetical protein
MWSHFLGYAKKTRYGFMSIHISSSNSDGNALFVCLLIEKYNKISHNFQRSIWSADNFLDMYSAGFNFGCDTSYPD